jgi:hypothetical protein
MFIMKTLFPQKLSDMSFTNPTSRVGLQLPNLWLLEIMPRCVNDGVMTIEPGHQTTGNAWYGQMSRPSCCFLFMFGEQPRKHTIRIPDANSETRGRFCDSLSSNIVLHYSVAPIITLHGRITAREYVNMLGNHVHPMIQTLFRNNDAVFQDDSAPIHTAGTVQSWFEIIKANFSIFPGQHTHQIWTLLNHSGQFWRLEWGTDSHLQHL